MATRPRSADVRADLLRHAAAAFEREGYVKASLARIAADAGYTKGAVYSGFRGKAHLFAEVCGGEFERVATAAMDGVAATLAEEGLGRAVLVERLAAALGAAVLDEPSQWPVLLHEFQAVALREADVATEYAAFMARRRAFLVDLLAGDERFAHTSAEGLERIAALLLLVVHALTAERLLTPDVLGREMVLSSLAILVDALLP